MESEEVKEIKEKLQEEIFIANSFGDKLRKVPTKELEKILALINELESENERLKIVVDIANERSYCKKFIEEWRKEYQKELDKQGKGYIAGSPDFDLVYKLYFEQKDRIAELEDKIENGTARKETVEKIFDTLYQWLDLEEIEKYGFVTIQKFDFLRKFREIYKQFGVGIKE